MNTDHLYRNVGFYRGQCRVFLDGQIFERRGIHKGMRYDRIIDTQKGQWRLIFSETGKYVVSGKASATSKGGYAAVIDILNADLSDILHGADKVRVDIAKDKTITISVHHMVIQQRLREKSFVEACKNKELSEGTLCVGIGMSTLALHEGFEAQGFKLKTSWIVDREAGYLDIAIRNNRAISGHTRIFNSTLEELERSLLSEVNICQFSLPCTGHSKSGKSRNKIKKAEQHPTDATAMYGLLKNFDAINAGVYISENVPEAQDSATYHLIRSTLQLLGYDVFETVLDNTQSGSFENRSRYWFVAVSTGLQFNDMVKIPTFAREYETLGELMDDISDDDPMWSDNTYLKIKQIRDAKANKGFAKRQLVDESATEVGCINRHYNKRQSTPPMVVRKQDSKERLLTVNEHARAKSCDIALVKDVGSTVGHEGLGQGVDMNQCRGLAQWVALALCNAHEVKRSIMPTPRVTGQLDLLDVLFDMAY